MGVKWRIEHIHFLLQYGKEVTIRTVLHVDDGAVMMRDLLYDAGGFDVENSQNS